jgi:hypothetical protein
MLTRQGERGACTVMPCRRSVRLSVGEVGCLWRPLNLYALEGPHLPVEVWCSLLHPLNLRALSELTFHCQLCGFRAGLQGMRREGLVWNSGTPEPAGGAGARFSACCGSHHAPAGGEGRRLLVWRKLSSGVRSACCWAVSSALSLAGRRWIAWQCSTAVVRSSTLACTFYCRWVGNTMSARADQRLRLCSARRCDPATLCCLWQLGAEPM